MVLSLSDVSSKGFGRSSWETFGDNLKSSRLCYCSVWATFRCVSVAITRHSSAGVTGLSSFPRGKSSIDKFSWKGYGFFFIVHVVMFTHAGVFPLTFIGTQEIPAIYQQVLFHNLSPGEKLELQCKADNLPEVEFSGALLLFWIAPENEWELYLCWWNVINTEGCR